MEIFMSTKVIRTHAVKMGFLFENTKNSSDLNYDEKN